MPPKLEGSLAVAESIREKEVHQGFISGLFEGRARTEFLNYFDTAPLSQNAEKLLTDMNRLLADVDPDAIDRNGEIPEEVFAALRSAGVFGIKIPQEYGGLGLKQSEYHRGAILLGSWDGNLTALVSAHNSIGVPEPIKKFGTDAQKAKFWPRLAKGEVSAFALTEKGAGCDIAKIKTHAVRVKEGDRTTGYRLSGEKLWITNGPKRDGEFLAKLLVVIARIVDDPRELEMSDKELKAAGKRACYGGFIVETSSQGMKAVKRLQFVGLRAIYSGVISFTAVYVPAENILGKEGDGLKIALTTLTTGRLTLPAACLGGMKRCLLMARTWAAQRVQWGAPIGEHEFISRMIVRIAARIVALEAIVRLTGSLVDHHKDVRLESAAAKYLGALWAWESVDDLFQIRAGRGYETAASLASRGETPMAVERMWRDYRINRIFEGTEQMMLLWIAREGMAALVEAGMKPSAKAVARVLWNAIRSYFPFPADDISRQARKIGRAAFWAAVRHQAKLQKRQMPMAHLSEAAMDLFAVAAGHTYVDWLDKNDPKPLARELMDWLSAETRKKSGQKLRKAIVDENDARIYKLVKPILEGKLTWLEDGILVLPANAERPAEPQVPDACWCHPDK